MYYCTDCESRFETLNEGRCPCGSGRVVAAAPLPEEVERVAKELRFLVSLNEPQKGGPYEGFAAEQCVKSMARAAAILTQQAQALADAEARIREMERTAFQAQEMAKEQCARVEAAKSGIGETQ